MEYGDVVQKLTEREQRDIVLNNGYTKKINHHTGHIAIIITLKILRSLGKDISLRSRNENPHNRTV